QEQQQEVVERLLAALRGGDMQGLFDVLAPEVVLVSDGGGLVPAVRRPIEGADRLVPLVVGGFAKTSAEVAFGSMWFNGAPGVRIDVDGELAAAVSLTVEDGRITRLYGIRNPHKLARLGSETTLA